MEKPQSFTLAVLDEAQVLRGFETVDAIERWVHTKDRFPVPHGCDLALGRYRLVEHRPGRFRFVAVEHALDAAAENDAGSINVLAALTRAVLALSTGGKPTDKDIGRLTLWLGTIDAKDKA